MLRFYNMNLICSNCKTIIVSENVNIATNLAKCQKCGNIHKASELVDNDAIVAIDRPPLGMRAQLLKGIDGSVVVDLPPAGFKAVLLFPIVFATFWLGFVAFWTVMASMASVFFAMFSIPFWFVGLSIMGGVLNVIFERQEIRIDRIYVQIEKRKVFRKKKYQFPTFQVDNISIQTMKQDITNAFSTMGVAFSKGDQKKKQNTLSLSVVAGVQTIYFFESLPEEEQQWLEGALHNVLKKMKA